MKIASILTDAVLMSGMCYAGSIHDAFGQSQYSCIYTYAPPYSTCDVMGNEMLYDIQKATVSFTNGSAAVSIYMNTGAVTYGSAARTLRAFQDASETLIPGDIFFYNPDDPTRQLQYGIALTNHGSFTAGDLYEIAGSIYTETAQEALQDGADYYRWDEPVLLAGSGNAVSSGRVTVSPSGDGIQNAQYVVTAAVPLPSGLAGLQSNGRIGLLFSSADCGNDVIEGAVDTGYASSISPAAIQAVPEPSPGVMMLAGAILLAIGRQWRKRTR